MSTNLYDFLSAGDFTGSPRVFIFQFFRVFCFSLNSRMSIFSPINVIQYDDESFSKIYNESYESSSSSPTFILIKILMEWEKLRFVKENEIFPRQTAGEVKNKVQRKGLHKKWLRWSTEKNVRDYFKLVSKFKTTESPIYRLVHGLPASEGMLFFEKYGTENFITWYEPSGENWPRLFSLN